MNGLGYPNLETIKDGKVPDTRMRSADAVQAFTRRLIENDSKRSRKRATVNGLVDGNPPYKPSKLRDAGRADACNVNWGTGRAYLESGAGAIYDLATEPPGFVGIKTSHGDPEHREIYGQIMSEETDRMLSNDESWDYEEQLSGWNMILHGCGPLMFEDAYCVLPRAFGCADLLVPERTKSDLKYWEVAVVCVDYYPPQLYKFIEDPEAASAVGWDVEYTKLVIENALDVRQPNNNKYDWEFYQQEMKNNSLAYYDDSLVSKLAYVQWLEFDGSITQTIVERETTTGTASTDKKGGVQFLFRHIGRFQKWTQCIHPMYYDRGNNGFHHSVTGLGVKMLSPLTYENRLICNLMDKTSAPKILFKPTSAEVTQKFQMQTMGDYGVLSAGYEGIQNPIAGMLTDGIAMQRLSSDLIRQNLSSYRQPAEPQKHGNPATRFEVQLQASQQGSLSKTTFNRYYKQKDALYTEIVRRCFDLNSRDDRAKEVQKRCLTRGVPKECFGRIEKVEAIRVIGQGTAFQRSEALNALQPVVPSMPEEGRQRWIDDKIAAEAGQAAVNRYNPKQRDQRLANDQQAEAQQWVACMKVGVAPVVTSAQNPVTFAATFMNAAIQAVQSLQKGANLGEVVQFLEICGPAIGAYLKRFSNDPLRETVFKKLLAQWKKLMQMADKLKQQLAQQQQQQREQQKRSQAAMSDEQIKQRKAQADIQIKQAKTQAQLKQSEEKHRMKLVHERQDMAISDASAASQIHINRLKAFADAQDSDNGD